MVTSRRKREESQEVHITTKKSKQDSGSDPDSDSEEKNADDFDSVRYEQFRDQRIKENLLRMQKLGIMDLSRNLKPPSSPSKRPTKLLSSSESPSKPSRCSSRLKTVDPVCYKEKPIPKAKSAMDLKIRIPEGSNPEIYTEEHDKLLGDCKTPWTVQEDGKRTHDPVNGMTCHQCRQKTNACHAKCSTCDLVQGQLCGDCLQSRYGENVLEARQNLNWSCLVCRGICNCSRCRKAKGWEPTGNIWRKVLKLGFKSVAHYLIQTRRGVQTTKQVLAAAENQSPAQRPISFDDDEPKLVNGNSFHSDEHPTGNLKPESKVKTDEEIDKSVEGKMP